MAEEGPGSASESVTASPDQPASHGLVCAGGSLLRLARVVLRPAARDGSTFRVRAFPDLAQARGRAEGPGID